MSKRLEMLEKVIAAGSTDPFAWYGRAMELRTLGRLEDALARFAEVRDRFPAYVPTYLMAGQVATELGRLDDARTWLRRGLAVAREAGDGHTVSEIEAALGEIG